VKDIGAIRHEKLYDKLISHIYHAAKRKLESLPKALIYLLDIAFFNILKRFYDIYK